MGQYAPLEPPWAPAVPFCWPDGPKCPTVLGVEAPSTAAVHAEAGGRDLGARLRSQKGLL